MSFDARTFRKAMGCFPTGVTIVSTLDADGAPVGVTISSFASLSLDPPLVLFCLDDKASCLEAFKRNSHFAINVLRQEQRELSIRFASKLEDKWKGVDYDSSSSGVPMLKGCLANFECSVVDVREGGDHLIFVGRVDRLEYSEAGEPLLYFRGAYAGLGCAVP